MELNIILMVGGILIAGIGMAMYFMCRNRSYRHSMKVTGIVTDSVEKKVTATDKNGNEVEGVNHLTYFRYTLENGEDYETARYTLKQYVPGQSIELKVDPDDQKDVIDAVSEGDDPKKVYTILMLIGLLATVVGVLMTGAKM